MVPFGNHLHGRYRGFDKYVWKGDAYRENGSQCVRLRRVSLDGEKGYSGNLDTTIIYDLSNRC